MKLSVRQKRDFLRRGNAQYGQMFDIVDSSNWPDDGDRKRIGCLRNYRFLVQLFQEPNGILRLSVNRTAITNDGDWIDGITWDELQAIKRQCGFSRKWAVEIFPPDDNIVNVSNMRHLWLMDEPLPFAWVRP